jgi:hypothetical protein
MDEQQQPPQSQQQTSPSKPGLTQEELDKIPQFPVEEIAAREYSINIGIFKRLVDGLESAKGLKRIMKAFVEYPLFDKNPVFMTTKEENIFKLGLHLQNCKLIMHQKALEQKLEKETKGEENGKTDSES